MEVRAFQGNYEFYILQQDLPCVDAGAVFYWDKDDTVYGSIAEGCLKLCWTPEGSCYGNNKVIGLCGNAIIFHAEARNDKEWFLHYNFKQMTVKEIEKELGYKIEIINEQNQDFM